MTAMTTMTEISELKTHFDAKFDNVFGKVADLEAEMDGLRKDVNGRFDAMDGRLGKMDGRFDDVDVRLNQMDRKIDLLLKAHGIEVDDA